MKLSIWQQFSSNHSANFMVVGQFSDSDMASYVAEELALMIADISAWWSRFHDDDDLQEIIYALKPFGGLSPPEQKYKKQYEIEHWGVGRDGVTDWMQSPRAMDTISHFNNLVIVNQAAFFDTWASPAPFDEILRKLGAKVAATYEDCDHYFAMNLQCTAPSKDVINEILADVKNRDFRGSNVVTISSLYPTRGNVRVEGNTLFLEDYQFLYAFYRHPNTIDKKWSPFPEEFQRLLAYLRQHQCTDIEYEIVEVQFEK